MAKAKPDSFGHHIKSTNPCIFWMRLCCRSRMYLTSFAHSNVSSSLDGSWARSFSVSDSNWALICSMVAVATFNAISAAFSSAWTWRSCSCLFSKVLARAHMAHDCSTEEEPNKPFNFTDIELKENVPINN